MNNLLEKIYNPDVLSCLANLSNDEVFTPPEVANKMIDLLPKELFESDETTFLDPCCKSGVFLREIMKRILNAKFPNYEEKIALINEKKMNKTKLTNEDMKYEKALQEKIDWVCHKQLYGISITRLTSLLSRRSLYCSKNANSKYSISKFDTDYGHIMYVDMKHTFKNGKCIYCGASESEYGEEKRGEELESHAYQFIHDENIVEGFNMKFDVIIGNPPYQMGDGGGTGDSAKPIYNLFIEKALALNPTYLSFIIPSRWMKGGKGLDDFRAKMSDDKRIKFLIDYEDASECFPQVHIDGGVCYFLIDKNYNGKTHYIYKAKQTDAIETERYLKNDFSNIIIRDYRQMSIIEKIISKNFPKFSDMVYSRNPYNYPADLFNRSENYKKSGLRDDYKEGYTKIYGVKGKKGGAKRVSGYIKTSTIDNNVDTINKYKLFFSKAYSADATIPPKIIMGNKNEICTETFLLIAKFNTEKEMLNCYKYMQTKFFRALLFYGRSGMNNSQKNFDLIPLISFKDDDIVNWEKDKNEINQILYKYFNLDKNEIEYIENGIKEIAIEKEVDDEI